MVKRNFLNTIVLLLIASTYLALGALVVNGVGDGANVVGRVFVAFRRDCSAEFVFEVCQARENDVGEFDPGVVARSDRFK